mgnify:CR=1 FL=1
MSFSIYLPWITNQTYMRYFYIFLLVTFFSCKEEILKKPNIIIVQVDDMGWNDLGVHGNKYVNTPHLDDFANNGRQFENFYVNPVCAPTRASLLTGRHFLKTGVSHVHGGKDYLNLSENTIGDIFRANGYATGIWGKWHSGHSEGYFPWQRGFDVALRTRLYKHREAEGELNGKNTTTTLWADEWIFDGAYEFLKAHKNEPCLAYISSMTCHGPLDAPDSLVNIYVEKGLPPDLSELYAMVDFFDKQFGFFLHKLEQQDLLENTIILFLSDNGPAINNMELSDTARSIRKVNPYKGWKGNIWENGVKSPLFIQWKGQINPGKSTQLCDVTDLVPTLLDLSNNILPENNLPLDGISFADELINDQINDLKFVFNYANPGWPPSDQPWIPEGIKNEYFPLETSKDLLETEEQIISVISGNYKLMINADSIEDGARPIENYILIDLKEDPFEEVNVATDYPDVFENLQKALLGWYEEVKNSPHSYNMPVFIINGKSNTILSYGAYEISPMIRQAFNYSPGWEHPGDYALYHLDVQKPGAYEIDLEWLVEPSQYAFQFVSKDTTVELTHLNNPVIMLGEDEQYLKMQLKNYLEEEMKLKYIHLNADAEEEPM